MAAAFILGYTAPAVHSGFRQCPSLGACSQVEPIRKLCGKDPELISCLSSTSSSFLSLRKPVFAVEKSNRHFCPSVTTVRSSKEEVTTKAPAAASRYLAPAPWRVGGSMFVFPFLVSRVTDAVCDALHLTEEERDMYVGGLGSLAFIQYTDSPVGTYNEVLFVPGNFKIGGETCLKITKIWVSSRASVQGGRENWGFPKQYAEIDWTATGEKTRFIARGSGGSARALADVTISGVTSLPRLPIKVDRVPVPLALPVLSDTIPPPGAEWARFLRIPYGIGGGAGVARIESYSVDGSELPDFAAAGIAIGWGMSLLEFTMDVDVPTALA